MACSSCFYYVFCYNFLFNNSNNDKFAGAPPKAFTKSISSLLTLLVFSCILITTLIFASTSSISISRYTNKNLQQVTKLMQESFFQDQKYSQNQTRANQNNDLQEYFLKACFLKLYLSNSHLACYKFCNQCKDYFDITKAIKSNQILFIASFFQNTINCR